MENNDRTFDEAITEKTQEVVNELNQAVEQLQAATASLEQALGRNNMERAINFIVENCKLAPPVASAVLKQIQQQFPGSDPEEAARHFVDGFRNSARTDAQRALINGKKRKGQTRGVAGGMGARAQRRRAAKVKR